MLAVIKVMGQNVMLDEKLFLGVQRSHTDLVPNDSQTELSNKDEV